MQINTRTPLLQFQNPPKKLTDSLSAAVFAGDDLWVASDETTGVEGGQSVNSRNANSLWPGVPTMVKALPSSRMLDRRVSY